MKLKITTLLAAVLLIASLSTFVSAQPGNIRYTKHNLSNQQPTVITTMVADGILSRRYASNTVDQICIFCHTPHNAQPSYPLWNKVMPTQTFRLYTSSPTLSSVAKGATLPADSVSLLCLSCHDGKTAVNVLHNASFVPSTPIASSNPLKPNALVEIYGDTVNASFALDPATGGGLSMAAFASFGSYKANLGATATDLMAGNNLADDHPIGFSYDAASGADINKTRLHPTATAVTNSNNKIRFFPPGNRLECSSCHDPHVSYEVSSTVATNSDPKLRPFLVMSNDGSALCLSCHIK